MASTILLKRSNTSGNDAYTGELGEVTLDTQQRKLRLHDGTKSGGHVVANMDDVNDVIQQVDDLEIRHIEGLESALATINSNIDDHEDRLSSVESNYIKHDGSVSFTGNIDANEHKVINVSAPKNPKDATNKKYVDDSISDLGAVFSYEGDIKPGTQSDPYDLAKLDNSSAGSYYTFSEEGYITYTTGGDQFVNEMDSVVFDKKGGYKIIDNTNSEIKGTTNVIKVTGSPDTGYKVDIDETYKDKVDEIDTSSVKSVDGSGSIKVDNSDDQNPVISIVNATSSSDGSMTSSDKSKLDGIESKAEVNLVTSVSGKKGDVKLNKSDVGLTKVENYATANKSQATNGNSENLYLTPKGVRYFIEEGSYTIDGGTF